MLTYFSYKELFLMFFGFGYLVNHNTKEIHHIYDKHVNCKLELISKNHSEYVTKRQAARLIKKYNYNGCRWCWPIQDIG